MPFTFSHPAIILPFMRVRHASVSMSALIIGAVTPDFEYFLKMRLEATISHQPIGVFLMDLPIATALFFIFHQLVKTPLIDHAPAYFQKRLQSLRYFDAVKYWNEHYIAFLVCLTLGILSHLFWDSLTHEKDLIVQKLEFFREPIKVAGLPELPFYRYFQHLSTLFGALAIGLVFHLLPKSEAGSIAGNWKFWSAMFGTALVIFLAVNVSTDFDYFGDVVAAILGALFYGTVATCMRYRIKQNGKKENVGPGRKAKG